MGTRQDNPCCRGDEPPGKAELRRMVLAARRAGLAAIEADTTTPETDDRDCYPHGIHLTKGISQPELRWLKELEDEFAWLRVDCRRQTIAIDPRQWPKPRLTELGYKEAIVDHLRQHGIECYLHVNWR